MDIIFALIVAGAAIAWLDWRVRSLEDGQRTIDIERAVRAHPARGERGSTTAGFMLLATLVVALLGAAAAVVLAGAREVAGVAHAMAWSTVAWSAFGAVAAATIVVAAAIEVSDLRRRSREAAGRDR